VWLLTVSSGAVLRLLRLKPNEEEGVTEEDVRMMVKEGRDSGLFDPAEHDIIERTFKLGDRPVRSLMTHRSDLVWLNLNDSIEANLDKMTEAPHHYFPLSKGNLHDLIGIVSVKNVWQAERRGNTIDLAALAIAPTYVIESMRGLKLLETFRQTHSTVAIVLDEHGSVEGIVTLNDLLEAVVGDLPSVNPELEIVERGDGTWLVDAVIAIEDFEEHFKIPARELLAPAQFTTLAGLIVTAVGHLPKTGVKCQVDGYELEVVDMDENRVDKVLVKKVAAPMAREDKGAS
jgi:putative hemolysin